MTASERIRAARLQTDKSLVSALDQNPVETRKSHNDPATPMSHAWYVARRGENPDECQVIVADWPYDCDAKHKHPDHTVYVCDTHRCWWHS